jgi:four helix bundle protein
MTSRNSGMHKYRSMIVWQRSHALVLVALKATDAAYHPRSRALFDQLRRAAISVEANLVEGYALGTPLQFRRHLRIAIGSAAETESLIRTADEMSYLPKGPVQEMAALLDETLALLFSLVRRTTRTAASR